MTKTTELVTGNGRLRTVRSTVTVVNVVVVVACLVAPQPIERLRRGGLVVRRRHRRELLPGSVAAHLRMEAEQLVQVRRA
jgi:hypothetical protein